jgi:hypothetical protein
MKNWAAVWVGSKTTTSLLQKKFESFEKKMWV